MLDNVEHSCRYLVLDGCALEHKYCCHKCRICPKCGKLTYYEDSVLDCRTESKLLVQVRVCPMCGNRTRGIEIEMPTAKELADSDVDYFKCEVEGCRRGAWELFRFKGWFICSFHRGQLQTYKYSKLPPERFPLKIDSGRLIENIEFNLYKAKKDKLR